MNTSILLIKGSFIWRYEILIDMEMVFTCDMENWNNANKNISCVRILKSNNKNYLA